LFRGERTCQSNCSVAGDIQITQPLGASEPSLLPPPGSLKKR
jgi:hypothetical protein